MKNLLLACLACLMPFLLFSDPCPDDTTPPLIESRGDTWDCSYNVFDDSYTNFITVTETSECGLRIVEIANWDMVKGGCEDDFVKRYTVTWYAEDVAGNVANFEQVITISRPGIEDIEFPVDTMVQCPASGYENHELYGYPLVNGNHLSDMCGFRVKSNILDTLPTLVAGRCLSEVRKEWIVIENCTGLTRKDTQDIILIDTIRPIIACTALEDTVRLVIDPQSCVAIYNFPVTDAIDFCAPDDQLVFRYRIDGEVTGSEVALMTGVYEGSVVVTDPCNNADTCYYAIVVSDDSPPIIECQGVDTVALSESSQNIDVSELGFSVEECTTEVDLVYRFAGQPSDMDSSVQVFTCEMVNTTVDVIITATDTSGNQSASVTCGVFVSDDGAICNPLRTVAQSEPMRELQKVNDQAKAYYDGQNLVLESETGVNGLVLYNVSGHIVWKKSWSKPQYNYLGSLPEKMHNGIYFLKIKKESGLVENVKMAIF